MGAYETKEVADMEHAHHARNLGDLPRGVPGYDPGSVHAADFIKHEEILASLAEADTQKADLIKIRQILEKAAKMDGITHREAALLLACQDDAINREAAALGKKIKEHFYGRRIVMFAPLYLSNYCVNSCTYCPYHIQNRQIPRRKLAQSEIADEVRALEDMGHKRLALEAGEDPKNNPIEYILESIETIYSIHHRNGDIRRVNVNIAATTTENYRKLHDVGIGTYILFQETYNRSRYEELHPAGPKGDYIWHTEAMDRAMLGGIDDVGIGVLFGLEDYAYELVGLLMHAEHLEARFGVGPHTISLPRICPADDVEPSSFGNAVPDDIFSKIITVLRLAVPYTGMIISTREKTEMRAKALDLGVTQLSGGSKTTVGGYDTSHAAGSLDSEQFDLNDTRSLDEVVNWLLELSCIPSFCTACYRAGRTGDRFMQLLKSGQIANCCQPNALMTLAEYLEDYAEPETAELGNQTIRQELDRIPNEKIRQMTIRRLGEIRAGSRDFRL